MCIYIALLLVLTMFFSHSIPLLLWQLHFWKSNNENMHSFLVKGFYSWREAREGASYHQPHSQYAPLFCIICFIFWSEQDFPLLSTCCSVKHLNDLNDGWYSLGYHSTAEYILLQWSFPAIQWEFPVSSFQLASPVCFVCHPKWFLSSLSICTLQMFADSYHIISAFPHPHPGLLAKLYIFSSFNLSS